MSIELNKRINADLKNLFKAYQSAIDCNIVASMTDVDGVIIHANEQFCAMSGYTEQELIGQRHAIINSGYHSVEFFENMWQTITTGKTWRGEIRNKAKDGQYYWLDSTILPVTNDDEEVIGFLSLRIEVTEKVALREKLQRMNNSLEEMIKLKSSQMSIKNEHIMASLRYAQRIQHALMPSKERIRKALPESFILFRPKAVVSGDFYFFHEEGDTVHFAAADGTGHGVPGAFLSIIGAENLEMAIRQSAETAEVLSIVNRAIHQSLGRAGEEDSVLDGLEMALCRLNRKTGVLQFSGAHRPLWIHRKGTETIEIIKGDRQCLCDTTEDGFKFSSHKLQLNEGDTAYIFSDGFADTFDETWSEKLKTAGFKKLLLQIKGQTMSEQHDSLNNFLNDFIGTGKQTDDILVFGVRYVQQP